MKNISAWTLDYRNFLTEIYFSNSLTHQVRKSFAVIGASFRVTLVVDWRFLPKIFEHLVGTYEGRLLLSECR